MKTGTFDNATILDDAACAQEADLEAHSSAIGRRSIADPSDHCSCNTTLIYNTATQQSAISNQQSATSNQQSAISNQQSARRGVGRSVGELSPPTTLPRVYGRAFTKPWLDCNVNKHDPIATSTGPTNNQVLLGSQAEHWRSRRVSNEQRRRWFVLCISL